MRPRISIITATYNRRELLLRKLKSLTAQTLSPDLFEWLVCINGSSDNSAEALKVETAFKLELIELPENKGASAGRNAAVKKAHGDILYFSDDDCLLSEELLEQHLARQTSLSSAVIGAIEFQTREAERQLWQPERVHYWNLNGANCSVPRDAFETVGGFDERLTGYGGEDLLLGYQLHRYGLQFVAAPDARARHIGPDPATGRDLQKAHSAGYNAALIASLYPQLSWRLGVHPALLKLKRLVFGAPLARLWQTRNPGTFAYEQAYFEGAQTFYPDSEGETDV